MRDPAIIRADLRRLRWMSYGGDGAEYLALLEQLAKGDLPALLATYERRRSWENLVDLGEAACTLRPGIAHVVARRIGQQVERDVLAQLLTLREQAA